MTLNNAVAEQLKTPIIMTWNNIAADAMEFVTSNEEALEMVLDANRMAMFGYTEADAIISDLVREYSFGEIVEFLSARIRLV